MADQAQPMTQAEDIETVDARGQACPYPILAARAALAGRPPGSRVWLLADDPLAAVDVAAWCARGGRRLIKETRDGDVFRFLLEVD